MIALFAAAMVALPAGAPTPSPAPTATAAGQLSVSPTNLALNPAQQRIISVNSATGTISTRLDANLVRISVDQAARTITVTATSQTGSDVVHVSDESGAEVDVPVRVALNAGTISKAATLQVTGNPVDAAWLNRQVIAIVQRSTAVAPGARASFGPVDTTGFNGSQATYSVPVQISGGDEYFDQSDTTNVTVQSVGLAPFAPPLLLYDDDPEHITQDGVLFRGTVSLGQPVRLYYYHDNMGDPRRLVIVLTAGAQPTSLHVVESPAGPNIDVMSVGHAVTRNFLLQKPLNEGIVVDLPPNTPYVFHDFSLQPRAGAAGNLDARVISGGPVTITVLGVSPGENPLTLLDQPRLAGDGHNRSGTFDIANFGNDAMTYTAGADAAFVYGDQDPSPPNLNPSDSGKDIGDYGVWHSLTLTLNNPTDQPAVAYLYERPIGGVARSSFLVNGQLIELGCVRVFNQRYQIGSPYTLAPHQITRVMLQTMSDGGSNYPLEIGITATPPNPTTPSINAPDGCFPKP